MEVPTSRSASRPAGIAYRTDGSNSQLADAWQAERSDRAADARQAERSDRAADARQAERSDRAAVHILTDGLPRVGPTLSGSGEWDRHCPDLESEQTLSDQMSTNAVLPEHSHLLGMKGVM